MKHELGTYNITYIESSEEFSLLELNADIILKTNLSMGERDQILDDLYDQIGAKLRTKNGNGFIDIMRDFGFWSIDTENKKIIWVIQGLHNTRQSKMFKLYTYFIDCIFSISQWNNIKIILMP